MKILILGGYGTFGGRLAQLLANDERLTLLIAGRSKEKADAFCKALPVGAQKTPLFFALVVELDKLSLIMRRWKMLGMPLPLILAPRMTVFESVVDGHFCFHVEVSYPIIGLIARYQGWLVPTELEK